jgi:hypothetical protein
MLTLSATCLAIAEAMKSKTLDIQECQSREILASDGSVLLEAETYWTIGDTHGTIEVCMSLDELNQRISSIEDAIA